VPTASTKQRARKKARAQASPANSAALTESDSPSVAPADDGDIPERAWRGASIAILAVAALLRLWALEINPLHHDEGVNGWFLTNLVRAGVYEYNPENYHGPTLYYFTLVPAFIQERVLGTGMSTFMLRMVTALFGIGIIWLVLKLRRYTGTFGALAAAALIAVSPGAVYQSRYFIHETLFVFFTVGIVVAVLRYYETTYATYLMLAFASAALLFATKETAFISTAVLALAWGVAWGWMRVARRFGWTREADTRESASAAAATGKTGKRKRASQTGATNALARFGGASHVALWLVGGVAVFVLINVIFYSSFFKYPHGVRGAIESLQIWTKTGNKDHTKPIDTYLNWLQQEEAPIYVLALLGAVWSLLGARSRFAIFAGAWAFGLLLAYSLVPYKTPWLALNFVVPMAIAGGFAANEIYVRWGEAKARRAVALALVSVAVAVCTYQTIQLNFLHYDDDSYPYVYAHTRREYLQLVREVEKLARRAGTGKQTGIAIASTDYWPSPWYFREYKGIGYHSDVRAYTEPIVIGKEAQQPALETTLAATHARVGHLYALRPGVNLVLYARRDLVEPGATIKDNELAPSEIKR
jgi:uncharacterized protein (TIGR03663 family)